MMSYAWRLKRQRGTHQTSLDLAYMETMVKGRGAHGIVLGLGIARLAAGLWLSFRPFDDTYITFRYALNLASGHGFVYNVGDAVLGTTSPLWALMLAGLHLVSIPMEMGSIALSLALDIASAILILRMLRGLEFDASVGLMAALLFLCWFDYLSLARSGMETSAFVFLVLAALERIVAGRFIPAAVWSGMACLTRPEGLLLPVALALALWSAGRNVTRRDWYTSGGAVAVIVGAWVAFALVTFGSVVPQSVTAKAATAGGQELRQFSWINLALFFSKGQFGGEVFSRTYLQLMPVVTALSAFAVARLGARVLCSGDRNTRLRVIALLFFPVFYVSGLALSHAFTFFTWYYGPIYPFLASLAIVGVALGSNQSVSAVFVASLILIAAQGVAAVWVKIPNDAGFLTRGYSEVSDVIPRREQVRIAAREIGMVGWRTWPATVLDLEGLVTPGAVGVNDEDYVREKLPDYLVIRTDDSSESFGHAFQQPWFRDRYQLLIETQDPYVERQFRTYKLRN